MAGYSNDEAIRFVDLLPLSKRDKCVLREYARYSNRETHLTFPSNKTIMRNAPYKLRAIQLARKDLIAMGVLVPHGLVRRVQSFILNFKEAKEKIKHFYLRSNTQNMRFKGAQNAPINNKGEIIKEETVRADLDKKEIGEKDPLLESLSLLAQTTPQKVKGIFQICLKYCGGDRQALASLIALSTAEHIRSPIAWLIWASKTGIYKNGLKERLQKRKSPPPSQESTPIGYAQTQFYKAREIWMASFRAHRDYERITRQWGEISKRHNLPDIPLTLHAYEAYYQ